MKIVPTNETPFQHDCIEWETLKVYPTFLQVHDDYRGVTVEVYVTPDGTLEVASIWEDEL